MKINLFKTCILFSLFITVSFAEINTVRAFPNLQFDQPVDLQSPNDNSNRIFILEQEGEILVFQNLDTISDATQFLDIRDKIEFQGEMGLLGLAFHPDYGNNGYFYVNYIAPNPRRTVIARYEVSATDSNTANNESEMIILEIDQPYNNHNGGQIAFGSDGFLYIGMGDGGSGGDPLNHGQNLSTLHGAMLRIDINNVSEINNYVIPVDNPYVNNNEGNREEIYAHGFRNPWRFSFDDYTGNCWIADVGQDEYEEISILEHGGNYGWNIMEGFHCFNPPTNCDTSGLVLPVYEYDHSTGESITGGYVYRGTMLPSLIGKYIFADFEYGDIYALEYNDANNFDVSFIGNLGPYSVTSFGVDQNNEIYICKLNGEIYKFIDDSSQSCYAEDGTEGVEIWEDCYSIQNTTTFGWPISIPDTATYIPENLFSLINLITLDINHSNISEPIPPEIGDLVNLTRLNLSNNLISGEIPSEIGSLNNLVSLDLSSNQLSGNIPLELYELSNLEGEIEVVTGPGGGASILHMGLNLSNNMLTGSIQEELANLSNLKFLDLSFNELSGNIPISLYTLDSLQTLNLSHNFLTGEISPLVSNLSSLSGIVTTSHMSITTYLALDLSVNQFSGVIPEELCSLSIDWYGNMFSDSLISIHQNRFCPPYPSCIEDNIGEQDTLNCYQDTICFDSLITSFPFYHNNNLDSLSLNNWTFENYPHGNDFSYKINLETQTDLFISTCDLATNFDTMLSIKDSCGNPISLIELDDSDTTCIEASVNPSFYAASIDSFRLQQGTYFIVVDGFNGVLGEYSIIINTLDQLSIKNKLVAEDFKLHPAYPNPFNPFTTLSYEVPKNSLVSINIYDLLGNVVRNLVNNNQSSGFKSIQWNATNNRGQPVSGGVYLYSIEAGGFRQTKKMILLK